uniref:Uncharacterized protein n=1 Tax=Rhizophora mucronata TaxID=61149 RepID=A0A2P2NMP2_RHIMU
MDVAFKAATLALHCISMEAKFRPSMAKVVAALEQIHESNENRSANSSLSNAPRMRRRSADDVSRRRHETPYPRPSASPIYA